ncbi:membrane protein [Mycobacterium phage Phabba]|uniref:Membrane protein n=1 Tax=Mycobacterium phage Phabba TaxID=2027899 RepID=A0A249XSQ7_9CAUD|nr:membrane protein [Mycobacterium phage Phabba]ASZ74769.1 membrane protein [Mycobacterium phage Phabba]
MNPFKVLRLVAILLGVFVLAFACSDGYYRAQADPDAVTVEPSVDDASRIEKRIESRLRDGDEIRVLVVADPQPVPQTNGVVFLYAEGKEVTVVGNDWVPQVWLDERLDRIDNVTRRPVDQIVRLIDEIHTYQEDNPRNSPAPEITVEVTTPPPGPPPPPPPPAEPFRWTTAWKFGAGAGGGFAILFIIWLPLHLRLMKRRKHLALVAKRAEEQAEWGYDKYGIKTTID